MDINVAVTSTRAVGGCNHISIYFVLAHFSVMSNIFKSEAAAPSYSGTFLLWMLHLFSAADPDWGIWDFLPTGIWSNFSPNWLNIRMWTKWRLETSPLSSDQTCCGWTTKGKTATTHSCSVSLIHSNHRGRKDDWCQPTCKFRGKHGCQ